MPEEVMPSEEDCNILINAINKLIEETPELDIDMTVSQLHSGLQSVLTLHQERSELWKTRSREE